MSTTLAPADEPSFTFVIRREIEGSFLGTSAGGLPTLIVPIASGRLPLDRASGDVVLSYRQGGTIEVAGTTFQSDAAIIECANVALRETFDVLADDIARSVRAKSVRPTPQEVSRVLARWEELLRGRRTLGRDEEVGLWGELWMLLQLPNVDRGVAVWRGPHAEYVDFVGGGVGIECKAGMRRLQHFVSQEQVTRPLGELEVFIASLWVDNDVIAGESLPEIVAKVDERLADRREFEEKLLATGYSRTDAHRYTIKLRVLEPPLVFAAASVPRVRSMDPGVSHVRYLATLPEDAALSPRDALVKLMAVISDA